MVAVCVAFLPASAHFQQGSCAVRFTLPALIFCWSLGSAWVAANGHRLLSKPSKSTLSSCVRCGVACWMRDTVSAAADQVELKQPPPNNVCSPHVGVKAQAEPATEAEYNVVS